jgi:hypothetical protein
MSVVNRSMSSKFFPGTDKQPPQMIVELAE